MEHAALDGEARGREIGVEIGQISLLQEPLGQRIWSAEEFAACDATRLNALADQLQQQLRARNS